MEGQIEDEDGDPFASLRAAPAYSKLQYCQSQNWGASASFPDSAEEDDDANEEELHRKLKRFSSEEDLIGIHTPVKVFDRFYDSSSSEEELYSTGSGGGGPDHGTVQSAGRRIDYMIQFLDRKLSSPESNNSGNKDPNSSEYRSLPEFVASGGGTGIFKVPLRAAVHPDRPPSLELRPQPLRETQIGCFLRTLVCTDSQLWAGSECGVKFWKLSELYDYDPNGLGRTAPSGDEEAAPFYESAHTSPTLCLVADEANRAVWSGHGDGKIRFWKMDQSLDGTPFRETLSWQAHRVPVLSMVMTSYGDLWSGSEGGAIKIWPWESIEKSLSLTLEERHIAALMVERSYIDLRSPVTMNGACNIFTSDVKYMFSDHSGAKVWTAGHLSFALCYCG